MAKTTSARLIYQGSYDWLVRLATYEPERNNYRYWYLPKREYTLDEAKLFRNERMRELEELGLRNKKRAGLTSLNIGMN